MCLIECNIITVMCVCGMCHSINEVVSFVCIQCQIGFIINI